MKTIIKIFICLSLIYTPFFAFAGAAEKWEVLQNNYDHVTNKVKIEARKITQDAANSGRYKVEVPVSPSALGKTVKTMLWTGIAVAGVESMLEGIGWIIDHGSQTIWRYKPQPHNPPSSTADYLYYPAYSNSGNLAPLPVQIDNYIEARIKNTPLGYFLPSDFKVISYEITHPSTVKVNFEFKFCTSGCSPYTAYTYGDPIRYDSATFNGVPNTQPNEQPKEYLDDTSLGNEIIGKGENTQPLPSAVQDAYSPNNPAQSEPAPQATQDALDNANPQPETEPSGETKPKPNVDTDGDGEPDTIDPQQPQQTEFKLPNFCSWAPAVCDFFKVQKADNKDIKKNQREQIEQDKTFFEKVAEWFDWSQTDDELPDNESPEIVEHVTPDLKEDAISWGAACPADVSIPISMQGVTSTLIFSWSPWCQLLSIIKPAIVASAYIGAAFIVLGLRT